MAAKRDPLMDWFKITTPVSEKNASKNGPPRDVDQDRSAASGYSRLVKLGDRLEQMEAESRNSAEPCFDSEQEWVSYFDQEEDQFITGRPVRADARPGDNDYAPVLSSDVFDKYYQTPHTYDPSYPITGSWRKIVETIESNPVTIIEGATGINGHALLCGVRVCMGVGGGVSVCVCMCMYILCHVYACACVRGP